MATLTITSSGTSVNSWGTLSTIYEQRSAQSFKITTGNFIVNNIKGYFAKYGAPSDSMKISIQADVGGNPSGTDISSTYATTASNTLFSTNPTFTLMTFSFTSAIILSKDTTYWIVVDRTGAHVDSNVYQWYYNSTTNDYADGTLKSFYNSVWNTINYDVRLEIDYQVIPTLTTDGLLTYHNLFNNTNDSLNHLNLTNSGATYTSSGKVNGAYTFNGSSNYMESATEPNTYFGGLTNLSISAWVKSNSNGSYQMMLISRVNDGDVHFFLNANAQKAGFGVYGPAGSSLYIESTNNVFTSTGVWYHVVFTWSQPNTVVCYINGIAVPTTVGGSTGTVTATRSFTGGKFRLGFNQPSIQFFNGTLDEIGIWNKVLTSTEVISLYNSDVGLTYPFDNILIGATNHYPCENGTGTTATDTISALNMSLSSSSIWNASPKIGTYCINPNGAYTGTIGSVSTFNFLHSGSASWSLNLWYYKSTALTGNCIMFSSSSGGDQNGVQCNVTNTSVYFHIGTSTTPYVGPIFQLNKTDVPATEGWQMLTITCDITANPRYKAYLNGVQVHSQNAGPGAYNAGNAANTMRVGNYASGGSYFMKERMDEITWWNRALSSKAVSDLYNSGSGLPYPWTPTSPGWAKKIFGITPAKINGLLTSAISKVNGI